MTRRTTCIAAAALLGGLLVCIAGVTMISVRPSQPSLNELLDIPPSSIGVRLYPGATTSGAVVKDHAVDVRSPDGLNTLLTYLYNSDGSTEDFVYRDNSKGLSWRQTYYPPQGPEGRHPHVLQAFAEDGKTVIKELTLRFSGLKQQEVSLLSDGRKHIVDYGLDGATITREQWFDKKDCCNPPKLHSDKRWADDEKHWQLYTNIIGDDGRRVETWFDSQERALKVLHWGKDDYINETTMVAYWPGTSQVRMESTSDWNQTLATFYREDGTRSYEEKLSSSMVEINYYDEKGTTRVNSQSFWRLESVTNGVTKVEYVKYLVLDVNGNDDADVKRDWYFYKDKLKRYQLHNVTIDGVHYAQVTYRYDDNENLEVVVYHGQSPKIADIVREEKHTPSEGIKPIYPPAEKMVMVEQEEGLPVPPPIDDD